MSEHGLHGMEELLKELNSDLGAELIFELHDYSNKALLSAKIKGAYYVVRRKRNYQDYQTEEFIDKDMRLMYDIIKALALYEWNYIGAEGETSHRENGISRAWNPKENILREIVPFATILTANGK